MSPELCTTDEESPEARDAEVLRPYLFVALHGDALRSGAARHDLGDLDLVTIGRGAERAALRGQDGQARALDLRFPGGTISSVHARLQRAEQGWIIVDPLSKNGTYLNGARVRQAPLSDGDVLEVGSLILRFRVLPPASPGAAPDLEPGGLTPPAPGLSTLLPGLEKQLTALARVAASDVPVLLLGETGSGKEVLARAVHGLSGRAGPLVAVNCGGLSASLLESQLFGHVKGSFTGATRDEPGFFRSAAGGTLFLDEIGDLPLPAQAAILRALQEREVTPVGTTRPVKLDVRIVAATHRPLEQMAFRGAFRADLLGRLAGYRHRAPPLRDRREDIGLLVRDLLDRMGAPAGVRLAAGGARALFQHAWPLNIRELSQWLAASIALCEDGVLKPPDPHGAGGDAGLPGAVPVTPDLLRDHIVSLLAKHRGKVSHVARDMGKARMQIHRWMQRFGIDPADYRG